jgi:hypothetical protein
MRHDVCMSEYSFEMRPTDGKEAPRNTCALERADLQISIGEHFS